MSHDVDISSATRGRVTVEQASALRPRVALPIVASPDEDERLEYMQLPRGMDSYRAPVLPEPEALQDRSAACAVLRELQLRLRGAAHGAQPAAIALTDLPEPDRELLAQVLGEGEVSARVQVQGAAHAYLHVQESRFAGVWRVLSRDAAGALSDSLEVSSLPQVLIDSAAADGRRRGVALGEYPRPDGLMNADALLAELRALWCTPSAGRDAHLINLSLLPLSAADVAYLDAALGDGSVTILSRGYGNCRISSTQRPDTWRVVYYNSQDTLILNTLEVSVVPEVACAAAQDFVDSSERLAEVLAWIEGA